MLAAVAGYAFGRKNARIGDIFVLAAASCVFVLCLVAAFLGRGAQLRLTGSVGLFLRLSLDGFRIIYGCVAGLLWLVTALFSPEYFALSSKCNRYRFFSLLTLAATLGVFFSADLFTAFLFFEATSLVSYAMVAHDESPGAMRAGETYLSVAIISGLVILMGMLLLWHRAGTLVFAELYAICSALPDKSPFYLPGALLIIGFGAKAGMFPLHFWLPQAHSAAPAPASALLSGILTKTGLFGIALVSCNIFAGDMRWGAALLFPASITMILGAALGVFSNNLKRTLACSSVSQIGFIITGVAMQCIPGEHNALAVHGALLHMLNHSLVKLVLFVSAGVVYNNMHDLSLDKICGFGRGKPLFLFVFLMGALGICGMPFWGGYLSKTLLHESIVEGIRLYIGLPFGISLRLLEWIFIFAGGLTIAYMLKLFIVLFVETNIHAPGKKRYISRPAAISLAISAVLIPLLGCFPAISDALARLGQGFFHGHSPDHPVLYFSWENLQGPLISAAIGVAVYFIVVRGLFLRRGKDGSKMYSGLRMRWFRRSLRSKSGSRPPDGIHFRLSDSWVPGAARVSLEDNVFRPMLRGIIWIITAIAHTVAALPDALIQLILRSVLRTIRKPYVPRKFLSRHIWVFQRQPGQLKQYGDESSIAGGFSLGLLFAGAGICIVMIFVFLLAIR